MRAFPREKKLIKIKFEIIKHSKAIELICIEIFKDKINRKATKARGMPINTQWTNIFTKTTSMSCHLLYCSRVPSSKSSEKINSVSK